MSLFLQIYGCSTTTIYYVWERTCRWHVNATRHGTSITSWCVPRKSRYCRNTQYDASMQMKYGWTEQNRKTNPLVALSQIVTTRSFCVLFVSFARHVCRNLTMLDLRSYKEIPSWSIHEKGTGNTVYNKQAYFWTYVFFCSKVYIRRQQDDRFEKFHARLKRHL